MTLLNPEHPPLDQAQTPPAPFVYATAADVIDLVSGSGIQLPDTVDMSETSPYLASLIRQASRFIERKTHRRFVEDTYTEFHDGTGRDGALIADQHPITEFIELRVLTGNHTPWMTFVPGDVSPGDPVVPEGTVYNAQGARLTVDPVTGIITLIPSLLQSYQLLSEGPMLQGAFFPRGKRNLRLTYKAGYRTVPDAITEATALQAGIQVLTNEGARKSGGVQSFSADGVSISYGKVFEGILTEWQARLQEILDYYTSMPVGRT